MRVLLTGGNGQVGTELQRAFGAAGDEVHAFGRDVLDITDREQVLQVVNAVAPEVIIHAGAMTNVDACELDPHAALVANSLATRHVAEAAAFLRAHTVYLSTDYVFDGRGTGPSGGGAYSEWDATGPISAYGRSKLGGEHEVRSLLGPTATIVRTSWVCGEFGHNFVKTMLRLAASGDGQVTVVDDQRGCPTFTADLAPVLRRLAVSRLPGTFHVSNSGELTWCEFAKAIFAAAGADSGRVTPISTAELVPARPAPRPACSVLAHTALNGVGLGPMPHWEPALHRTVDALR
jgi:dTDP-4-dehydrorhamnose reductase